MEIELENDDDTVALMISNKSIAVCKCKVLIYLRGPMKLKMISKARYPFKMLTIMMLSLEFGSGNKA